ncbi:S-layer homology domain-containing protein [Pseudoflavonifractor phocaeensis]|uniref:S-layer homology domain-containing protein n=1 Tax=Pseudoflavonifractor phocaeensis TaxID=1870988 RepID=UPI0019589263|nr:S-layer homology domain-containing protein [Pseudoflavonifractor phocaeensis]MBM6924398.1 S-layer homology domain-containing protein [Pseudoflavonifractor phocaeensis]
MKKRLFSICLAMALSLGLLPGAAGAESGTVPSYDLTAVEAQSQSIFSRWATALTLNRSVLTLHVGDTSLLSLASGGDGSAVTWTSSNAIVASVNSTGQVTARSAGTAIITASVGGKTAACPVIVSKLYTNDSYPSGGSGSTQLNWTIIEQHLLNGTLGNTVTANLYLITQLPGSVLTTLSTREVNLVLALSDNLSWTIRGSDLTAGASFPSLDMGVKFGTDTIPAQLMATVTGARSAVQITLAHSGSYGFPLTLSIPMGAQYGNCWANVYAYDQTAGALVFEQAVRIAADGSVALPVTHGGQYAIAIDDRDHTLSFADVPEGAWYEDGAAYVYRRGLMEGTSDTAFSPDLTTSRAMIATTLWRLAGSPKVSAQTSFSDVAQGSWYSDAVAWASTQGIINGYDNGTFGANDPITREQLAVMLWRRAGSPAPSAGLESYPDGASVSSWAADAMAWAVDFGFIQGDSAGAIRPQGQASRAEVAVILMRFAVQTQL